MEVHVRAKFTLPRWLGFSLLLHAVIAVPLVLLSLHQADHARHNKLSLELFGMVSNRPAGEPRKGGGAPKRSRTPQQHTTRHVSLPGPKPSFSGFTSVTTDSPVQVEETGEKAPVETGPVGAYGGGGGQGQESTGSGGQAGWDVIAEYLDKVGGKIQKNLLYPEETRKRGVEGVCWISFTISESGAIKEGSLRVRKSSGYDSLDSNALKSALAAAPFEKPPKQLTVKIGVEFNVEVASRANLTHSR